MKKRSVRIALTLLFTGLALSYLVWKIDLHQTIDILGDADPWWFVLSVSIMVGTALPMALRWQWLLAARGVHDRFAAAVTAPSGTRPNPRSLKGNAR